MSAKTTKTERAMRRRDARRDAARRRAFRQMGGDLRFNARFFAGCAAPRMWMR